MQAVLMPVNSYPLAQRRYRPKEGVRDFLSTAVSGLEEHARNKCFHFWLLLVLYHHALPCGMISTNIPCINQIERVGLDELLLLINNSCYRDLDVFSFLRYLYGD